MDIVQQYSGGSIMRIVGLVTGVDKLPPRDGGTEFYRVSIEGLGLLCSSEIVEGLRAGSVVDATVKAHWRAGRRPVHFLTSWATVG